MAGNAQTRAEIASEAREQLENARDAYSSFQDAMSRLGDEVRRLDDWMYQRVDAYPGWTGNRDVGSGRGMTDWLQEIDEFLEEQEKGEVS
jgi:hypothetical protein